VDQALETRQQRNGAHMGSKDAFAFVGDDYDRKAR
jgi:hypothetical protein